MKRDNRRWDGIRISSKGMKATERPPARTRETAQLVERLRQGDVPALARTASLAEDDGFVARIDHLGIAVRSIAGARRFYELLGLTVLQVEEIEREGVRAAMIPAGESHIELLEPLVGDSPVGRFLARRGEGLHHVALQVDDISQAFEEMKQAGLRLTSGGIQIGAGGHLYFFVHPSSAGGVLVEICQDPIADVIADV